MNRKQQQVFAGLSREANRVLWYIRLGVAGAVILAAVMGAACAGLVNLLYSL